MDTPNGYTDAPQKEGVMSALRQEKTKMNSLEEIQAARQALSQWEREMQSRLDQEDVYYSTVPMVVGLSGNPKVWHALDALLADAERDIAEFGNKPAGLWTLHLQLAEAIIAGERAARVLGVTDNS